MLDFVRNWLHFVRKAGLSPLLVGAADLPLLKYCNSEGVPAAAISPSLDVWTYKQLPVQKEVYEMKSEWKYFRHHNSDFLEMGLVKVAFLWELLSAGFDVLISDLDVVWLNSHWARWMTYRVAESPPLPQARLIATADILVSTDELNAEKDLHGGTVGMGTDLNTGVVYFRGTVGSLALVQQWRKAMLERKDSKNLNENVNDQMLFNLVVKGSRLTGDGIVRLAQECNESSNSRGLIRSESIEAVLRGVEGVRWPFRSGRKYEPCLPGEGCEPVFFSFGTLPMRPFTGGHTWFNQNVQSMPGHEEPMHQPITVHFTFQFGDTGEYPHGKRQRAREAGLWVVDPPEYFTEGIFVALEGATYSQAEMDAVYKRFPSWSPQRHMFLDAPQRQAVRDLLGFADAVGNGITVLPERFCHCDRYWGTLSNCRFPFVPNMPFPFSCPMDTLYETSRWNKKSVRFREHTFLSNQNVPATLPANKVVVTVAERGVPPAGVVSPSHVELAYGTRMSDVKAAVEKANPAVRLILIANADLRRLCRWLGSAERNREFNKLMRYILTESSRYCPMEDHGGYGGVAFDWQNPFTGLNCTWGFHHPAPFPEAEPGEACAESVELAERGNSTTCPRQMLCDWNIRIDGTETKPITWCNIEGYNGMMPKWLPLTRAMLRKMPDGRCPYPPGDVPGMLGFDSRGHYVGTGV